MLPQRPTREQLIDLAKSDPEAIADLVLMLWDRVEALEARVRELERNTTRLPTATAVVHLRRIAAASTRLPNPRACGTNPVGSLADKMGTSERLSTRPILRTASSNIVSAPGQVVRTAGRFLAKVPGHFMRRIASVGKCSNYPPFVSRSSSIARSAASARTVKRWSPPAFLVV